MEEHEKEVLQNWQEAVETKLNEHDAEIKFFSEYVDYIEDFVEEEMPNMISTIRTIQRVSDGNVVALLMLMSICSFFLGAAFALRWL